MTWCWASGWPARSLRRRAPAAGLLTDIRAALARIDLNERLADSQLQAETDRMRAALLSSVSHDLKTPLATIMGPAAPCWNTGTG